MRLCIGGWKADMPTYRYECKRCEEIQEVFHSISEKPRKKCPECGVALSSR